MLHYLEASLDMNMYVYPLAACLLQKLHSPSCLYKQLADSFGHLIPLTGHLTHVTGHLTPQTHNVPTPKKKRKYSKAKYLIMCL